MSNKKSKKDNKKNKLHFLFIYPDLGTKMINFSPAIQLLSAILKREGYQTSLIHINNFYGIADDNDSILNEVQKYNFDVVGFTASSFQFARANEIAGLLKGEFPEKLMILGGIHVTIKPEDLSKSNFDVFCIGEGDEALPELLKKINNKQDYFDTKNFHFKLPDGTIKQNPVRHFVRDLNTLPFRDMDILDMRKLLRARKNWLSISFSRGCPHKCTFCINPLLLKINISDKKQIKNYFRKIDTDNVICELVSIINRFRDNVFVINFDDDLLMLDKRWMLEFTEKYKTNIFDKYNVNYVMNCRVDTIDDEIASKLAESGCLELRIGFETGDEKLRNTILNKKITNRQLVKAFRTADKYGIHTNAFTMMGLPEETESSIRETIRMITILKPFLIRMTFLYPYYNTAIYNYCKKKNLIKKEYKTLPDSFTESPLKFEHLTDAELLRYRFLFPWYVNLLLCDKFSNIYLEKIKKYETMDFEQLRNPETFNSILNDDTELSNFLTAQKIPHYEYFCGNLYYFHFKGKYGFK